VRSSSGPKHYLVALLAGVLVLLMWVSLWGLYLAFVWPLYFPPALRHFAPISPTTATLANDLTDLLVTGAVFACIGWGAGRKHMLRSWSVYIAVVVGYCLAVLVQALLWGDPESLLYVTTRPFLVAAPAFAGLGFALSLRANAVNNFR
jgi:hypothetical protein